MEFKKLTTEELKQCIISGKIKLDGCEERKFDLIDFYLMSDEKPASFLKSIRDNSKKEEINKIERFFNGLFSKKNKILKYISLKELLNVEYNYKGHNFSMEEKEDIISFLNNNRIPINEITYFCTARKYVDGFLNLYVEEKAKVRSRKKVK